MAYKKQEYNLKAPKDINLNFFTYGIFKPRQIAYSKIKNFISQKERGIINYPMKHRDGIPILINKEEEIAQTHGYILHFNKNKEAYDIISKSLSNKLYKWGTVKIRNEKVNVLFGVNPRQGSNFIENNKDRRNFDGRNDPLFKEAIKLIEKNLNMPYNHEINEFFSLQMNYMLLWSAIDRYCKLKYNKSTEHDNRIELSKEESFKKALKKYGRKKGRSVFSTDTLFEYKFNTENPQHCMNYYYTLRCNVVHRGKTSIKDIIMLKEATDELLNIFKCILNDTFSLKPTHLKKKKKKKNFKFLPHTSLTQIT